MNLDLPAIGVRRGGITFPVPAPDGQIVSSGGWCAPSDFILDLTSPSAEVVTIEPCDGVYHRWERSWEYVSQCDCPQCAPPADADLRRLECEACPAEMLPGDDGFDAIWATAE